MSDVRETAIALAALEVLPAEPSDLGAILTDPAKKAALVALSPDHGCGDVTTWLCGAIDIARVEFWEKHVELATRDWGVTPILADDPRFPARLAMCWDGPPLLFLQGALRDGGPVAAIVGNRDAEDDALEAASELAQTLSSDGTTIVSGLAAGIDTAAHEGALAVGGYTIAVLGTGILRTYPIENIDLARRISETGGLISQFRPDAPPTSTSFLRRNSVIAGMADVSIVMGGQPRSGSRHQSEQAVRYGRRVLLWAPTLREQAWARQTVESGDAEFVSGIDDVRAAVRAYR